MRFLLVIIIWVVIVGGLWGYISHRDDKRLQATTPQPVNLEVEGRFAIELTPTFSTEEDPFALTTTVEPASPLQVKLNGKELTLETDELLRGQTVRLDNISGMLAGHNEIYINASPPLSESSLEHGIRLKVFEDSAIIVDKTLWASQGALVSGTISFSHLEKENGDHDH